MKRIFTIIILLVTINLFSQNIKKESEKSKTKMETFASKVGVITKFTDINLEDLKTSYDVVETRIREVSSGNSKKYFYQIEKSGKYSDSTASIEYSDLIEVIKALNSLKSNVNNDIASNPDYMENKFTTEDGFQIGYYISKGKVVWYIKLEKYGSKNTVFIKDVSKIENTFNKAKEKIEEIQK